MSRSCPNKNAHGGCAIRLQESSAVLIQRLDRWMAMFVFLFTRKDLPITAVCPFCLFGWIVVSEALVLITAVEWKYVT